MSQVVIEAEPHHREEQNLRKLGIENQDSKVKKRHHASQPRFRCQVGEKSRNFVRFFVALGGNPQCGPCCSSRRRAPVKMRGPLSSDKLMSLKGAAVG